MISATKERPATEAMPPPASVPSACAGPPTFDWPLANEAEQATIRFIKERNGCGCSFRAICKELEKAGHRPVGQKWHHKTIGSILKRAA